MGWAIDVLHPLARVASAGPADAMARTANEDESDHLILDEAFE